MDITILVSVIGAVGIILVIFLYKIIFNPLKISKIVELMSKGDYSEAAHICQKMLEKDPDNPRLHYLFGDCYTQLGNFAGAKAEYNYLFRYNLDLYNIAEEDVRYKLAEIYLQSNQIEEALKELLLVAKKKPDDISTMLKIGNIFKEFGKWENAISYYQKALSIDKTNTEAIFSLGEAFYNRKQYKTALKFLSTALKTAPNSVDANYFAGLCYKELGELRTAITHLKKASMDKRLGLNATYSLGLIYFELQQYNDAIETFRNAASFVEDKKSTTYLNIMYALAESYQRLNKIPEAIDIWESIYNVRSNFRDVVVKLSKFQHLKNDEYVREFLLLSNENFMELSKKIIHHFGCKIVKIELLDNGKGVEAQTIGSTSQWKNIDKLPVFFYIIRDISEPITQREVGMILDKMKITKSAKAYLISPSYTVADIENYAISRPIEIISRDKLTELLQQVANESLEEI
ncbi:MAG: tetratricopeptide repeat protein [Spirochaetes bacterium]|nr:tetratricopeptide repeat protein [Spirochaetota bacterium]NLJ04286.1 tetratricopeptide repeat protein [Exilispira sp.]HNV44042.1 tetratricopeptide repeat protein [Exilispira sp.]HOV46981.1 tetratricopeptide repeat protein [Exilispira sp.]HQM89484.1 tetratricopeptide repeat protein [Exilispira sp.]